MVADWAEAIDGKLYVMGGGFTAVSPSSQSIPYRFALAAIVTVPAGTSHAIPLSANVEDGGGKRLGDWELSGQINLPVGSGREESAVIAGPVEVVCPPSGEVVVRMRFGAAERSVAFRIVPQPVP